MPLKEKFPFITEIYPKDLSFEVSGVLGLNGASVDLYSYSNEQGTKIRLPSKTTTTMKEEKRRSKNSRTRRYMWVEFVVGSCPCSEGFSPGSPDFLPSQKSTLLNSNSIWKQWMKSHSMEMPLQIPIIVVIIIIIIINRQSHNEQFETNQQ